MPRIEIHNLQELAERPAGKTYLGELIRRLVYATVARHQPSIHFLAGESNGYAGGTGGLRSPMKSMALFEGTDRFGN